MTWDASDGYALFYGGSFNMTADGAVADTWTYQNGTWSNITAVTSGSPPPLVGAALAYDPSSDSVILFGGENGGEQDQNQTWSYHDHIWTNLTSSAGPAPQPRIYPGLATDPSDDEIVMYGGINASGASTLWDTWTFSGGKWANVTATAGPIAHAQVPVMSYDGADSGVLLTGAASFHVDGSKPYFPVTFVFSGGVWKNLTASLSVQPPLSLGAYAGMAWLPGASAVLYYLGAIVNPVSGAPVLQSATWEFVGGAWTNITTSAGGGPGVVLEFASAGTATDSALIAYGGFGIEGYSTYTYALSAPPTLTAAESRTSTDIGQPVTFTGAASGGLLPNAGAWSFGDDSGTSGDSATHSYSSPGAYSATFTVVDFAGQSTTVAVAIVVNPSPSVSITVAPGSPVAGSSVGMIAVVSGGTGPFTYSWSLGDGASSSNASVSHAYAQSGSYLVSLTLTDAIGLVAKSNSTVHVAAASSSSVSLTSGTGLLLLIVIVALLAALAILAVLYARKGKGPRPPPTQFAGPTPSAPGTVAPATGPSPPWSEGPPPGAFAPPPPPTS